jgi:hypothetical protein
MFSRLLAAALLAVAITIASSFGSPFRASAVTLFTGQSCSNGVVSAEFAWSARADSRQWLDLSIFDNGFEPGSFLGVGPFLGEGNSHTWIGLLPGTAHFARLNQQLPDCSWDPSVTFQFYTMDCGVSIRSLQPGSEMSKLPR